jgi:uncharacterized protein (DUF1778 family)
MAAPSHVDDREELVPVEAKSERIHARLAPSTKALVREAAALAGRPISDFLVDAATEKALATIRAHRVWTLTTEQSLAFAQAILDPPPPTAAMRERYRRYLDLGGTPFPEPEPDDPAAR